MELNKGFCNILKISTKKIFLNALNAVQHRTSNHSAPVGKLDSERTIDQGTHIKDITYLSLPEKEFLIFVAYFSRNLHFFFHLNFEFPSMMDADLTLDS